MGMNGGTLRDGLISAANNIANQRKQVDALNVFPIPDGDTGTNMSMTMNAAKRALLVLADETPAGEVAGAAASALLRGARGNSGVILSLLIRGFAKGLQYKQVIESADLVESLEIGVEMAYKAVMKPTEGTILTVARESAAAAKDALRQNPGEAPGELWSIMTRQTVQSVERTPELLPVLKKAGVVDAGGQGLLLIYQGMEQTFRGLGMVQSLTFPAQPAPSPVEVRNAAGEHDGEINFTYCTEFIVLKETSANPLTLRAYLESIGDSVVVVDDDDIIKCHVHTDDPGKAMQKGLESGQLTGVKVENMREQHVTQKRAVQVKKPCSFPYQPVDPLREYGVVAVAAGDGVKALFADLGVDNVVSGGQSMNPSTDSILEAVHATPAKQVLVLPNNKNIIMAAEQTVSLADRKVFVLPTRTIPQGLSAMLAFDPGLELEENRMLMIKAAEKVQTGQVTFAARDSSFEGHKIRRGEILALENGKIAFVEKELERAVYRLTRSMVKKDTSFVTVLYGEDVSGDKAMDVEQMLRAKLSPSVELTVINGGQPVYYFILSVE